MRSLGRKPATVPLENDVKSDLKPVEKTDCSARYQNNWKDHHKLKETLNRCRLSSSISPRNIQKDSWEIPLFARNSNPVFNVLQVVKSDKSEGLEQTSTQSQVKTKQRGFTAHGGKG